MLAGDLVWFGPKKPRVPVPEFKPDYNADGVLLNWRDCPIRHVAICAGNGRLLHASKEAGTNVIWPIERFSKVTRYQRIYRISRLYCPTKDLLPLGIHESGSLYIPVGATVRA
jgi:hypothetical protein